MSGHVLHTDLGLNDSNKPTMTSSCTYMQFSISKCGVSVPFSYMNYADRSRHGQHGKHSKHSKAKGAKSKEKSKSQEVDLDTNVVSGQTVRLDNG